MCSEVQPADKFLDSIAESIRALEHKGKRGAFEIGCKIGEQLARAQEHLSRQKSGNGGWLDWLSSAFPYWPQRSAYNYIGIYRFATRHGSQFETVANSIDLSAIYLLNASSTPPEAVTDILERAGTGEKITRETVKDAIEHHRSTNPDRELAQETPPPARRPTKSTPGQPAQQHRTAEPAAKPPEGHPEPSVEGMARMLLAEMLVVIENCPPPKFVSTLDKRELAAVGAAAEVVAMWASAVTAIAGTNDRGTVHMSALEKTLDTIANFRGSAGDLMDWWRGQRKERKALDPSDQDILSDAYNAKFTQLHREAGA